MSRTCGSGWFRLPEHIGRLHNKTDANTHHHVYIRFTAPAIACGVQRLLGIILLFGRHFLGGHFQAQPLDAAIIIGFFYCELEFADKNAVAFYRHAFEAGFKQMTQA